MAGDRRARHLGDARRALLERGRAVDRRSAAPMVAHVGGRDYPGLARRRGGTIAGSLWNAFAALVLLALLFSVSLPLWLIPLLWPALPIVLFGYFNQRVFRYDALAEHGTAAEID